MTEFDLHFYRQLAYTRGDDALEAVVTRCAHLEAERDLARQRAAKYLYDAQAAGIRLARMRDALDSLGATVPKATREWAESLILIGAG